MQPAESSGRHQRPSEDSAEQAAQAATAREANRPSRVLVVGGGTAGWITATLMRRVAPADIEITLVESSDVPTVGVGEATLPGIRQVLRYIGIPEDEFLSECNATFKLGIAFSGWNPRRDFWHPFGAVHGPTSVVNEWLRRVSLGDDLPIDTFLDRDTWKVAQAQLSPQSAGCSPYTGDVRVYAYHLDAGLYAELLKRYAIAAGVRHVVDDVTGVEVLPSGWISHVNTANRGQLSADLFFDCTGFRGLLINQALGEPFESYGEHLWCDRAVAINVPRDRGAVPDPRGVGSLPLYTRATARSAGWIWEIPLFNRSGDGYVYSSAYQDADSAEAELRRHLGVGDELPARHLRMRVGKTRRQWVHNCIAVGLAGGFIEPLESTGIGLIEEASEFFLHNCPDLVWDDTMATKLNAHLDAGYEAIRDFVATHYITAAKNNTDFWRDLHRAPSVRTPKIDQVLAEWDRGQFSGIPFEQVEGVSPFMAYSWAYIIGGNQWPARRVEDPHIDEQELTTALERFGRERRRVTGLLDDLPDHYTRLCELRQQWQRGETLSVPPGPDSSAYADFPNQLLTGYLSDGPDASVVREEIPVVREETPD